MESIYWRTERGIREWNRMNKNNRNCVAIHSNDIAAFIQCYGRWPCEWVAPHKGSVHSRKRERT